MQERIDLEAYFERIGFRGAPTPSLETLQTLHALHPAAIAFEGLSPFLGEPVSLAPRALEEKLVRRGRGGYCFEQNVLFWRVLEALGFRVRGLGGRVRLNWPEHVVTPRGHMLLAVELPEGLHIADVGFGGLTLTAALRLEPGVEQATPHEPARIVRAGAGFAVQASIGGDWRTLYTFDLQDTFLEDYEVWNWYYAAHPRSPFVEGPILARPERGRRHALRHARYTVHVLGGASEARRLASVEELCSVLEQAFHVPLPAGGEFERRARELLARAT